MIGLFEKRAKRSANNESRRVRPTVVERTGGMSRTVVCAPEGVGIENLIIARLRVRRGAVICAGQPLLEWKAFEGNRPAALLRAPLPGVVVAIHAKEGDRIKPGQSVLEIEACTHPTVMKDMCADCGADLRRDDISHTNIAVVPMVHSVPELKVSEELAQKIGKEDSERLLKDRKLVLLVDLDQTLIHTTNDNIPPNIKDVYHFRLRSWGPGGFGGGRWYHTRLRPGTKEFLKAVADMYELHICTFGARAYAHQVAELLDPHGELFSHRILSRDECFDMHTKTPNLRALFPCGDNLVCIIDDREDVWNRAANLIQVKPYHFFEHTGDINAPPGLEKTERDVEGQGVPSQDPRKEEMKCTENDQVPKSNVEMPPLDSDNNEDKMEINQSIDKDLSVSEPQVIQETKISIPKISELDYSKPIILPDDISNKEPEKAIVKDIEKIVSKVQENFINSDTSKNVTNLLNSDKNDFFDKSNIECTSNDEMTVNQNESTSNCKWKITETGEIDVEDSDDYLLYLEEILKRIHKLFYEIYDSMEAGSVPDLKTVIPQVKGQVLSGTSLVFSGLVPTHQKLEHSRAYLVAQSLGAEVTQDFTNRTTHLVAVRPGTAKVHACRRITNTDNGKTPYTVTPSWLWCCAERWQHVDEKLFPLRNNTRLPRRPPPHCGSPPQFLQSSTILPRKRTPSGRFMDTINPLLSFSSDDIANMDKEVEDIINESDESDSETKFLSKTSGEDRLNNIDNISESILKDDLGDISSDSAESLSDGEYPHGWKPDKTRKRQRSNSLFQTDDEDSKSVPLKQNRDNISNKICDEVEDVTDEEILSENFRRGGALPSDAPDKNDSETDGSIEPSDDIDDGEWNMMGAALEREFLGLDK